MDYKQFSQDVNDAKAAKTAIDNFAKNQVDGVTTCPRCGRMTVKEKLATNAMSRYAHVYICDACGLDEAIRDMKGIPLLLKDWAAARKEKSNDKI